MNRLFILIAVFIAFVGYTIYVVSSESIIDYMRNLRADSWSLQVFIDLCISCTLLCIWMVRDAKTRGKSQAFALPFVIFTLIFGSISPLAYLIHRETSKNK